MRDLAKVLCEHLKQSDTYMFKIRNGILLIDRNVLKALHATGVKVESTHYVAAPPKRFVVPVCPKI